MTQYLRNIIKVVFVLVSSFSSSLFAQPKNYSPNYFRSPVDFTITLSGNFGELRNNHFHSGIDIRTFTTGKKIYSIANGFVSRIKISARGYGKAIYIDHPNGYTSVYAHIDHFTSEIENFVKAHQYKKNSFEFDLYLDKDQLIVNKGDLIAFSGNTGSSAGPHLHFEIRDTKSEHPLNPLFFNFKIKDTTPPKIVNLYAYPLNSISSVNGYNTRQKFPVTYSNNAYHLKGNPKVRLSGKIGFALQTNDYMDNTWGKCGIYELQLMVNDTLISKYAFDEFSFDESRYINSHMDYGINVSEKRRIHKTFREENNLLSIYSKMKDNGIYFFNNGQKYEIDFLVKDAYNNKSSLKILATGTNQAKAFPKKCFNKLMNYQEENLFQTENIMIKFPKDCFYTPLQFTYSVKKDSNYLSSIHTIHNELVPVHKYYTLSIKPDSYPSGKSEKLYITRINRNGKSVNEGGVFINGNLKTKTRYFGDFAVAIDTIAPAIKAKTNFKLKSLHGVKSIQFIIKDDMSGIKSYKGTIDGKWVLFEYDAKNDLLFYTFDKKRLQSKRKHTLKLIVNDKVDNSTAFTSEFFW